MRWYYLGTAYEDVGEFDKAIEVYNRALNINPGYKDALHDLSLVYIATGNTKKARQLLPRLMSADPGWGKKIQLLPKQAQSLESDGLWRA